MLGCVNIFLCQNDSSCFDIWYDPIYKDKIGIDGGLGPFDNGQLNCLCLNTMEVFVIKKEGK